MEDERSDGDQRTLDGKGRQVAGNGMVDGYVTPRRRNKTLGRQKQTLDHHRRSAPFLPI